MESIFPAMQSTMDSLVQGVRWIKYPIEPVNSYVASCPAFSFSIESDCSTVFAFDTWMMYQKNMTSNRGVASTAIILFKTPALDNKSGTGLPWVETTTWKCASILTAYDGIRWECDETEIRIALALTNQGANWQLDKHSGIIGIVNIPLE